MAIPKARGLTRDMLVKARDVLRSSEPPPPRNDPVPASVERVLLVAGGLPRGELPPIAPPGVGELVLLHGAMFPVLSRTYDPETRTARVEILEA